MNNNKSTSGRLGVALEDLLGAERKWIEIVTHDGQFHADEVFASAVILRMRNSDPVASMTLAVDFIRTRALGALPDLKPGTDRFFLDVGGVYDPAQLRFDHHQREGAGERPSGIPYATSGLVWKHIGPALCTGPEVHAMVDSKLFAALDAADCGFDLRKVGLGPESGEVRPGAPANGAGSGPVRPMNMSAAVSAFNPTWNALGGPDEQLTQFKAAVAWAGLILDQVIRQAESSVLATEALNQALAEEREDRRILVLRQFIPWQETIAAHPEVMFVVFPPTMGTTALGQPELQQWNVQCAPGPEPFSKRLPLPEAWAGLEGSALANATGVRDAVFCHRGRFICGARTYAGAMKLARLALRIEDARAELLARGADG